MSFLSGAFLRRYLDKPSVRRFLDGLFVRQFIALSAKNWIVLGKQIKLNIARCLILPVFYGVFLAEAQFFFSKPNNFGIGQPAPIGALSDTLDGSLSLFWTDGTNGTGVPSPSDIMSRVTSGFSSAQMSIVHQVASQEDIVQACPQNFNLVSECFAAVSFDTFPSSSNASSSINYTIFADGGLFHIDVIKHKSDYEERVLPLQWAIDSAIIELQTGTSVPTPLEWPYSIETNKEQANQIRLSYVRGLRELLVLAFFICYIGIAYQLPGAFMAERANHLASHQKAMGVLDSARIMAWYSTITTIYQPAWTIVAVIWHFRIFTGTSVSIVMFVHMLLSFSLTSWAFFVSVPFGNSPQLAAVTTTILSIVFAILAQAFGSASTGAAFIFSIIFPPGFYIFAIRAIAGYETHQIHTNIIHGDPDNHLNILALMIAAIIAIVIWPYLAIKLERKLYDPPKQSRQSFSWLHCFRRKNAPLSENVNILPQGTAISIRNLNKTYSSPWYSWKKQKVTAIEDLTLDIPKSGIYVLLGSNGAGKSTALSILGGLQGKTSGQVIYENGTSEPGHGVLGIVPQKNVLFPELTCLQTLTVWEAMKRPKGAATGEDLVQLLKDCDLETKINANAATLSGGQKRKLQLAIGLVGGSKILLVDECTSGVDPLSRRALWRTLVSVREERTIIFTTHFLDEAELIGDGVGIMNQGKLLVEGSPVSLKSDLGQGYTVKVTLNAEEDHEKSEKSGSDDVVLERIRTVAPDTFVTNQSSTVAFYHLKTKSSAEVSRVLSLLEKEKNTLRISSYDVHGASMEDIFLALMKEQRQGLASPTELITVPTIPATTAVIDSVETKSSSASTTGTPRILRLSDGRRRSPFSQAFTIFHKRCIIARRSWLTPVLSVIIAVAGSCIPLFFLSSRTETCSSTVRRDSGTNTTLFLPLSPLEILSASSPSQGNSILTFPPNVVQTLGPAAASLEVTNVQDNATFVSEINQNFQNLTLGGISIDFTSGDSLIAWEATPPGLTGPTMVNLATNVLYNNALNATGKGGGVPRLITPNFETFPGLNGGTLIALKWDVFFGAAMAVFPAFYALYVSNERRSSVQAMQLSNGLADPIGLWLGHLMFDVMFSTAAATIIIIIFATVASELHGLVFFWVVLMLYGITGTLFAYCASLLTTSPLAAFAAVAGYQIIIFLFYLAGYLLTFTFAKTSQAANIITIIHFTLSILSPVASPLRASFVSVNLFSLLCDNNSNISTNSLRSLSKFGGPILYLIIYGIVLFAFLVWFDSGSKLPQKLAEARRKTGATMADESATKDEKPKDVLAEAAAVSTSSDALRVMHISKQYSESMVRAVDDVSFGVERDTVLVLLGPNGAGKTSTFDIIRGDIVPDQGDVLIQGTSVIRHPRAARLSLGVCPQFTAIDSQLTVREHLAIYGRLKGLYRGTELNENIDILLESTALTPYADRFASNLSGGNQRKLSLAIALIGNPSVLLVDEFSTGVDAQMKRDMWETLKNVAIGKAVVLTTHSMEEASALASKVGIIASKMLAVGSTESLTSRYPIYQVHFSCRTREEATKAQELMARIPGSRKADDVATRFEVPLDDGAQELTLAGLFKVLAEHGDFSDYTVERVSLESVFLKVIRENNIKEEDSTSRLEKKRWYSNLC